MKNILMLCFVFVTNLIFSQDVFERFEGLDDVTAVVVNKKMFQMIATLKIDAKDMETQQYLDLIRRLDHLKVFITTNSQIASDMKASAFSYSKGADFKKESQFEDTEKNTQIAIKPGEPEGQIKELLLINEFKTKEKETILLSLIGNFTIEEVRILMDKMKIPGSGCLIKTKK